MSCKQFLVSRNEDTRKKFISKIKGKMIAIYNRDSSLLDLFDVKVDMNKLMKDDYFLTSLSQCDGNTSVVLVDVLVKNGTYVHPYGRIYKFCETAKKVYIIDSFAFKWDERQIVRPFLFINPSVLGSSLITFMDDDKTCIDTYFDSVKPYIETDFTPIVINCVKFTPTKEEIKGYEELKQRIIMDEKQQKSSIVYNLIKYVDELKSKKEAVKAHKNDEGLIISSNNPRAKMVMYDRLMDAGVNRVTFFSSGHFGADEIELKKMMDALYRHNYLIDLLNGYKTIQPK